MGIKIGNQEWPDLVCGGFIEVFYKWPPVQDNHFWLAFDWSQEWLSYTVLTVYGARVKHLTNS